MASAIDPTELVREVQQVRKTADTVIVYVHWGTETQACPNPQQGPLAQQLVKAGADIVIGSNAHVLLGAGYMGSAYVDYGLGNFAFYDDTAPETDSGSLIVTAVGRHITGVAFRPATILNGLPQPLTGAPAQTALQSWNSARSCTNLAATPSTSVATMRAESVPFVAPAAPPPRRTTAAATGGTTTTTVAARSATDRQRPARPATPARRRRPPRRPSRRRRRPRRPTTPAVADRPEPGRTLLERHPGRRGHEADGVVPGPQNARDPQMVSSHQMARKEAVQCSSSTSTRSWSSSTTCQRRSPPDSRRSSTRRRQDAPVTVRRGYVQLVDCRRRPVDRSTCIDLELACAPLR